MSCVALGASIIIALKPLKSILYMGIPDVCTVRREWDEYTYRDVCDGVKRQNTLVHECVVFT